MVRRDRADRLLVERGYFDSRAAAQLAIRAGLVTVEGAVIGKASQIIDADADIVATPVHPYVSRGGVKLAHALKEFHVDVHGKVCLDIGASTGGFSDVLLRHGARKIYAVDVGRDQFHHSLRDHNEIVLLEQQDARHLSREHVPEPPELVVCDASFIGLEKVLPVPLSLAAQPADLVALFKPQFEVGRDHVGKGGIVADEGATAQAQSAVTETLDKLGWSIQSWTDSPIAGGDGNREYLFHAIRSEVSD